MPPMLATMTSLFRVLGVIPPGASDGSAARLRPLDETDWSPEVQGLLGTTRDRVARLEGAEASSKPGTLSILRTIAHHPKLLGPFLGFAASLAVDGELTRRDSELLALRTAWNCQSDFEWGHHVVYASAAGLGKSEIARIAIGPAATGWDEPDQDLLLAADRLHSAQQIEIDLWRRLEARFTPAQLVEIPFVVGQYTMLSMVANSTGVELENGFEPLPR